MPRLRRILAEPFRLLYWLNYGHNGSYRRRKSSDPGPTRPLTHAELDRTTQQIENNSNSGPRYDRGMWR